MSATYESPGVRPGLNDKRVSDVYERLANVVDPELDEPVTDLNFISNVEVDENDRVKIAFRLPTYWCAPNFAFMMVDDLRRAAGELSWVQHVTVELGEHMYADAINTGVAEGRSFQESFGSEADGELHEVRRTFMLKAFQRRQEALILHMLAVGFVAMDIISMTVGALEQANLTDEGRRLSDRYLQRREVVGSFDRGSRAFVTTGDDCLESEGFDVYLKGLRRVRVNAEFNGALCRGLLAVRFDTSDPALPKAAA